jgi:hypothetical protein
MFIQESQFSFASIVEGIYPLHEIEDIILPVLKSR